MLEEPNMSFLSFVKRQTYATQPRQPLISQQSSCVSLLHVEMAHVCPHDHLTHLSLFFGGRVLLCTSLIPGWT